MRRVALAIEIPFAHDFGMKSEAAGCLIENLLDYDHSLRAPEPAESRLRSLVSAANVSGQLDGRQKIGVIGVKHRAIEHRLRQIQTPTAIGVKPNLDSIQAPVVAKSCRVASQEGMPLAGKLHVESS